MQSNFAHQQKSQSDCRFLHHSLDRFFTPTLSLVIKQRNPHIRMGWLLLEKLFLLFLWVSPALLIFLILSNLGTEIKQMRQSLDRLDNVVRASDPASTETITITTTIFSSLPSTTMEMDDIKTPFTTNAPITSSIDPTPSPSNLSTGDQSRTDIPAFTSNPTPPSSLPPDEISLITIPPFLFEWSNLRTNLPPAARKTVDKVLGSLGTVWQIFRKAYHYPLDPP